MSGLRSKNLLWWLPAFSWAVCIFTLSSHSTLPGGFDRFPDYVLHFGAYALLAGAIGMGFLGRIPWGMPRPVAAKSCLIASLYGLSDEFHQMFVPGRHPSWWDLLADAVGALCAVILLSFLVPIQGRPDER